MRLIDADAVEKQAYDDVHYHAELEDWEFDVVTHYLDHAPTIDAVHVVRCSMCKHKNHDGNGDAWCDVHCGYISDTNAFCSYGERKGGDTNGLV